MRRGKCCDQSPRGSGAEDLLLPGRCRGGGGGAVLWGGLCSWSGGHVRWYICV